MITRIEAYRYRCFQKLDIEFNRFGVLVGANGSGKSTLLDVVPLLSDLLRLRRTEAAFFEPQISNFRQRADRPKDLIHNHRGQFFSLVIEVKLPEEIVSSLLQRIASGLSVASADQLGKNRSRWPDLARYELQFEELNDQLQISQEYLFLLPSDPKGQRLHGFGLLGEHAKALPRTGMLALARPRGEPATFYTEYRRRGGRRFSFSFDPSEMALANVPSDKNEFGAALWFRELLTKGVCFYNPNPQAMRQASPTRAKSKILSSDGSALPWLIAALKKSDVSPLPFKRWLEVVRLALPAVEDIVPFSREDDHAASFWVNYRGGYSVPASAISDGSLRILAHTILPYAQTLPALLIVEEPENGTHPRAVQTITEALRSVRTSQLWLSTHSPIVLANVELSDIICLRQSADLGVTAIPGPQHPALSDWKTGVDLPSLFAAGVLS